MTIQKRNKIYVNCELNLFSHNNNVYNLDEIDKKNFVKSTEIGGITWELDHKYWYYDSSEYDINKFNLFRHIMRLDFWKKKHYSGFIIDGDRDWRPDTKRNRYFFSKLYVLENGRDVTKIITESTEGIKFTVIINIDDIDDSEAYQLISTDNTTYLFFLPDEHKEKVQDFVQFKRGWRISDNHKFVDFLLSKNGVLINKYGAFDDPFQGYIAIAHSSVIQELSLLEYSIP